MASKILFHLNKHPRTKLAVQLSLSALIPAIPILYWSRNAKQERAELHQEVSTKLRIPSVQTIDDLMVEKCQPGDIILFDRRCECCASGAAAAMGCLVGKAILCEEEDGTRSVERGSYEHCGIVVPGQSTAKGAEHDPSNLCLLEATSGSGIACRPLLTRLEMSRSRSVILLPLSCPGERRYEVDDDDEHAVSEKTKFLKDQTHNELVKFREKWLVDSQSQNYQSAHSNLSIMGALLYVTGLYPTFPVPISPSAWLVTSALQECGAAMKLNEKQAQQTKVEDFTRDGRFFEKDTVRLRPGWKFLSPVVMRENSVS
mmetsp:Transcript_11330/g.20833  ORF Transcript_11330/g.20833 Transcript_11330/m.20833 type:complete len:315 (+) Transcript_11330:56-1000(+)|eukprot:CAMPEP_0202010628 /NCGR_PEP_ID=MMETSP0905-20130828/17674_1 /ASSEMBLY_ACC=CAM_ASM_000554 /TAXON_ID=420261 /ORGANISM="Thalassiosira antarctica, Strain CCMP982" /LENGTH=314 /DNA_ID=CAMNT_0048569269 /DNA_START=1 /DNA_END=945 /DNA_ORIENTATION=+